MGTGYDIFITEGAVLDSLVNSVHTENNEPAKKGRIIREKRRVKK